MHVLFLDDSYNKREKYLGHGGFCIQDSQISHLIKEIEDLKSSYGIPRNIELKWSPDPSHYLNTKFTGSRRQLWKDAIKILCNHNTNVICVVHDLKDCYGVKTYGWDPERTRIWATKQQLKYISERYEKPYLSTCGDCGLIIADEYGGKERESSITEQVSWDISSGTKYRQFERLSIHPLTTISKYCSPLQLADLVIGIVVASLASSRFALKFFENIAKLFLINPHERSITFACTFSRAVLGFGLTLFPRDFRDNRGMKLLNELDLKYIYTTEGLQIKK